MSTVAIAKLKASLSTYLRKVQQGEEVVITDHGRPVARITPVHPQDQLDQHLQDMIRQGQATVGSGRLPKDFWSLPRPQDPTGAVLKAMLEDREDSTR